MISSSRTIQRTFLPVSCKLGLRTFPLVGSCFLLWLFCFRLDVSQVAAFFMLLRFGKLAYAIQVNDRLISLFFVPIGTRNDGCKVELQPGVQLLAESQEQSARGWRR